MAQVFNPYLPSYEYIPDGEPHVFGERLYVYGSHDRFNGKAFCYNDYVCYSAPLNDLSSWKYEGVIYRKNQTPPYYSDKSILWAPDVARGKDGRYYLYFFVGESHPHENKIQVAVAARPEGPYDYLGPVVYADGVALGERKGELKSFDPAIFVDDDGRVFLYSGFGAKINNPFIQHGWKASDKGPLVYELETDMLTVKKGPYFLGVPSRAEGTPYEGHAFFEASSLRKFNGKYYFIYSSEQGHELCYAISHFPDHDFSYGGTLVSIGDIGLNGRLKKDALNYTGNTHGSIAEVAGNYYVFYHRQTNLNQYSRQGCAERILMDDNGYFAQAEITSCGLNGKPLLGMGTYPARIACNLSSKRGTRFYGFLRRSFFQTHPYFTQEGKDREENPNQYIANLKDGAWCAFKSFKLEEPRQIAVRVRTNGHGKIVVALEKGGPAIAEIALYPIKQYEDFVAPLLPVAGVHPLYFTYQGKGHVDFLSFTLS